MKDKLVAFFSKFTRMDIIIVSSVISILVVALLAFLGWNKFSHSPVKAEKDIVIQVFFKNLLISTPDNIPFKVKEKAFMTIRNVPYKDLEILAVNFDPKKTLLPANNKDGFVVVTDVSAPLQFDFLITLKDKAKVTDNNEYVIGGNKIKTGLPIVLEGGDYRFSGVVSAVMPVPDEENQQQNPQEDDTQSDYVETEEDNNEE